MTGIAGRSVAFTWNSAAVLGIREKGVNLDGAEIDVTSDENSGWQTLLAAAGQNAVTVSLSGVTKDKRLKNDWFALTRTRPAVLTYPDGSVLSGTFYLASFKESNPYNDAQTFDAELKSTGTVTWTPAG
jgi:predicted secreted protein